MTIRTRTLFLLITTTVFLTSCATYFGAEGRRGVSSSLVDYLYPEDQVPPEHKATTPHLRLPLTVGLAFVPPQKGTPFLLPEAKKTQLLEAVKKKFINLDYIKEIAVVPETYMQSSKGFDGVAQIARLYGLDIVALVSYDQVAVTSEKQSSLLYWTIVGAYFIKGNQNQITTFVDTAVFDVSSRKMLFRAPGVSDVQHSSTLIGLDQNIRASREKGFELAMTDMTSNLATELSQFKEKIKTDKSVQITHQRGVGGAGGTHWPALLIIIALAALKYAKRNR